MSSIQPNFGHPMTKEDTYISALKLEIGARRAVITSIAQTLVELKTAKDRASMGSMASIEIGKQLATTIQIYQKHGELLAPFENELAKLLSLAKAKPAEEKKKEGEFVFKVPKPRPPKQLNFKNGALL